MPHSFAVRLRMTDFKPTMISLILVDRSRRILEGVLEDVSIKIGECMIPNDFVVLEYDKEPSDPLILERSFLATVGAIIDVKQGNIALNIDDLVMNFEMDKLRRVPTIDGQTFSVKIASDDDLLIELHEDITAGYVKELETVEKVSKQAVKLEDWSGDHLISTRDHDEVLIHDKSLVDDVFVMETRIAEESCRTVEETRVAGQASIDAAVALIDTPSRIGSNLSKTKDSRIDSLAASPRPVVKLKSHLSTVQKPQVRPRT
ncbi:PREDICTED: uncharacterized protein LOC104711250 [Camelina sativa]|uniref:Uncharacterized protein LOC104711250 n=1 Tax=Camelina sativa TaxID=90675 RepID=A0ABM0TGV4_CAMSA|nr:PREDICTED: uncharacterized protein LOC104711250 [Camelina sativa]